MTSDSQVREVVEYLLKTQRNGLFVLYVQGALLAKHNRAETGLQQCRFLLSAEVLFLFTSKETERKKSAAD